MEMEAHDNIASAAALFVALEHIILESFDVMFFITQLSREVRARIMVQVHVG